MSEGTNAGLLERRLEAVPRGPFHVAPIFVERGQGAWVWDVEGRQYIDFTGGLGVLNVGHNHPRVVAAVRGQAERLLHSCFHVAMHEPYVELCERLNRLAPIAEPCRTVLFNSGAEAVENAVKVSRAWSGRSAVVAFERGFHGRTLLGMSLTGKCRPYAAGLGPFAPEVYRLPFEPFFADPALVTDGDVERGCEQALEHLAAYHIDPGSIACLIVEPVLGEGGFHPIRRAALRTLRTWCSDNRVVLVADEIQTGFGRCGALFATQRYGVEPDVIAMAKSMAGGMVLSGITGRAEVMDAADVGTLGGTFGGNPVACAAALAVLDALEGERLVERSGVIGDRVMQVFERLVGQCVHVSAARGLGAMCAIEIADSATGEPDPARATRICGDALERGLLLMTASGNVIRTLIPLVIDDETLEVGLARLSAAVEASG